jgi:phosphoglycolate phosphatase-like HAD superfamily hydrolase
MATLLLDLDGTLLDVRARHYAVHAALLSDIGLPSLPEPLYWRRRRTGVPAARLVPELHRAAFRRRWLEQIENRDQLSMDSLYSGARSALSILGQRHKLVLVTLRRDCKALAWQLHRLGILECFERVLATGGASGGKAGLWPDHLRTGDEIVVGDGETDLEFARALRAPCVSVTYGMRTPVFLSRHGADRLAASPGQVVTAIERLARHSARLHG